MPRNTLTALQEGRTKILSDFQLDEISKSIAAEALLTPLAKVYRAPRPVTDMIIAQIDKIFVTHGDRPLPAVMFDHITQAHSPPMIIKIKKLMGIKSIRADGHWHWTPPVMIDEDRDDDEVNKVDRLISQRNRPVAKALYELIKLHGYSVLNLVAIESLSEAWAKTSIVKARMALGIVSVKKEDGWHWVMPDKEVQDWLLMELHDCAVPIKEIMERAKEHMGWSEEVIYAAKAVCGGIIIKYIDKRVHWAIRGGNE